MVERAKMPATIRQSRAKQWSRAAWGMALLFASLPLASKLFLGAWGFDGAAELSFLSLALGTYLHVRSRRAKALRDSAAFLEQAMEAAASGEIEKAIAWLAKAARLSPRLWQAYQYRGELYLRTGRFEAALEDFTEAIRLAPEESHLHALHAQAQSLIGNGPSADRMLPS
jgi:tetratricopeptide (TPR) repeat protein